MKAHIDGRHIMYRDGILVAITGSAIQQFDTTRTSRVASLGIATDSCSGSLYPFGPGPMQQFDVDWPVSGGLTEIDDTVVVYVELPRVDHWLCRLRFLLLDEESDTLTVVVTRETIGPVGGWTVWR